MMSTEEIKALSHDEEIQWITFEQSWRMFMYPKKLLQLQKMGPNACQNHDGLCGCTPEEILEEELEQMKDRFMREGVALSDQSPVYDECRIRKKIP